MKSNLANLLLIAAGAGLIGLAAYNMGVLKVDRRFWLDLLPNALVVVTLAGALSYVGGVPLLAQGGQAALKVTMAYAPLLMLVFCTIGEATVLTSIYKAELLEFLGGRHGIWGSFVAGMVMPTSIAGMPIIRELWEQGADKAALVVFLMTTSLLSITAILIRQPMLGWPVMLVYLAWSAFVCLSFMAGAYAYRLGR